MTGPLSFEAFSSFASQRFVAKCWGIVRYYVLGCSSESMIGHSASVLPVESGVLDQAILETMVTSWLCGIIVM